MDNKPDKPPGPPPEPSKRVINNLSDPKYNCVWSISVLPAPDSSLVRSLLQLVADAVAPVLRYRGWRVKRLMESVSKNAVGLCTGNGRNDADGA
ncbi:hypothetical protein TrRE_jg9320, partial [Triparma retinervis]